MNRSLPVVLCLLLGACQSAPTSIDENSNSYPPPIGKFTLKNEITIPAHSAHATLQDGRVLDTDKPNQNQPNCRFDVQRVSETNQIVSADEFTVKRVYRQAGSMLTQQFATPRAWRVSDDGGPTFRIYRTVYELESARQPQARQLSCEQWDHPSLGNHLNLRQIRTALGEVFSITLAEGVTEKGK